MPIFDPISGIVLPVRRAPKPLPKKEPVSKKPKPPTEADLLRAKLEESQDDVKKMKDELAKKEEQLKLLEQQLADEKAAGVANAKKRTPRKKKAEG